VCEWLDVEYKRRDFQPCLRLPPVTVRDVHRISILIAWRILCFLRFLLFQDETNNMHPLFANADRLSGEVIGAAIEVHRIMGPGLLETESQGLSCPVQTSLEQKATKGTKGENRA
jgi:hypothetical protein